MLTLQGQWCLHALVPSTAASHQCCYAWPVNFSTTSHLITKVQHLVSIHSSKSRPNKALLRGLTDTEEKKKSSSHILTPICDQTALPLVSVSCQPLQHSNVLIVKGCKDLLSFHFISQPLLLHPSYFHDVFVTIASWRFSHPQQAESQFIQYFGFCNKKRIQKLNVNALPCLLSFFLSSLQWSACLSNYFQKGPHSMFATLQLCEGWQTLHSKSEAIYQHWSSNYIKPLWPLILWQLQRHLCKGVAGSFLFRLLGLTGYPWKCLCTQK